MEFLITSYLLVFFIFWTVESFKQAFGKKDPPQSKPDNRPPQDRYDPDDYF